MSTIINNVRWNDNTLELRNNLLAGIGTLDVMRTSVDRTVASMGGSGLYGAANKAAVAIQELGGVTKLTTDEQERNLATIDKAIAKYQVMGQVAPQALLDTSKALHDALQPTDDAGAKFEHLGEQIKLAFENPTEGIKQLSSALATELTGSLASVAAIGTVAVSALLAVGAAAFEVAERAAAAGGALNDMAEKTGLSVPALSRLSNAVQVAGGDMNQISTALFMLQKNLGEDSDKVNEGLSKIGLNVETLKAAGPDQYLALIAEGFAKTEDPAAKAAAAVEIFNKQGREIIPTLSKLNEALAQTNDIEPWTAEQAKQAEAFDMQMASLKVHAEALAISFGRDLIGPISEFTSVTVGATKAVLGLLGGFGGILTPVGALRAAWGDLSAALEVFRGKTDDLPKVTGPAALSLKAWQESATGLTAAVPTLTEALSTQRTAGKDLDDQYKELHKSLVDAAQAAQDLADKALRDLYERMVQIEDNAPKATFSLISTADALSQIGMHSDIAEKGLLPVFALLDKIQGIAPPAAFALHNTADVLATLGEHVDVVIPKFVDFGKAFDTNLSQSLRNFPSIIARGFSTGDWSSSIAAIGGDVGTAFGKSIASEMGDTLKADLGATFGGVIKDLLPGLGGLVAGGLQALFSLGGPSKAELAGRQLQADFEKGFGGASQMIQAVGAAYVATGRTVQQAQADVQALFNAEKNGAPAVQAAIDKINLAFTAQQKLTGDVKTGVDNIVSAAGVLGSKAPASLQPMIDKLLTMNGLTDDEKKALSDLSGSGTPSINDLTAAAGRYGLSLDSVGGKAAQLSISSEADQIESDYKTLVTDSGADSDKVLAGMKDSLNTLVGHALDAGAVLPTALEPLVKQLFDTGQLTDSTGKRLDDLSKITFSDAGDPLANSIDTLSKALDDLIDLLSKGLPAAAADGAKGVADNINGLQINPVHIPLVYDRQDSGGDGTSYAATGGRVLPFGIQRFAVGGFALPRVGTDTVPAMLTPGELILNQTQQTNLSSYIGGLEMMASGSGVTTIHTNVMLGGRSVGRSVERVLTDELGSRRYLRSA